jgi:hypothetical protein
MSERKVKSSDSQQVRYQVDIINSIFFVFTQRQLIKYEALPLLTCRLVLFLLVTSLIPSYLIIENEHSYGLVV